MGAKAQWRLAPDRDSKGTFAAPALANLCAYWLDIRLETLAQALGATYSRYADDLVFSGGRQQVTGIVVNRHANIARDDYDRLKAILTNCVRHGPQSQNREGRDN